MASPRGSLVVVHEPSTLPASVAGRSSKRVVAVDPGPALDAAFPISPSREQALFNAARSRACPHGLPARPRSHARHRPGHSVRGGPMRADGATNPGLIHQPRREARPRRRCAACPQRRTGISTLRGRRNARAEPDHMCSFLRTTERACACADRKTLGSSSRLRGRARGRCAGPPSGATTGIRRAGG